eukprot:TRINITY_DN8126_c0_g1_i1.p1 TRINITY_DN8126_c0_g1~~TRINITY_DN8126_c0_g1_i1.p1  ORF type:complete len:487 (+),score=118.57 TRINITY_DN8126_c0_g1_i1:181-1641(+)
MSLRRRDPAGEQSRLLTKLYLQENAGIQARKALAAIEKLAWTANDGYGDHKVPERANELAGSRAQEREALAREIRRLALQRSQLSHAVSSAGGGGIGSHLLGGAGLLRSSSAGAAAGGALRGGAPAGVGGEERPAPAAPVLSQVEQAQLRLSKAKESMEKLQQERKQILDDIQNGGRNSEGFSWQAAAADRDRRLLPGGGGGLAHTDGQGLAGGGEGASAGGGIRGGGGTHASGEDARAGRESERVGAGRGGGESRADAVGNRSAADVARNGGRVGPGGGQSGDAKGADTIGNRSAADDARDAAREVPGGGVGAFDDEEKKAAKATMAAMKRAMSGTADRSKARSSARASLSSEGGEGSGQPVIKVFLVRPNGNSSRLGAKLDQRSLRLGAIQPGGLLAKWNQENPDAQVKADDRICEVNGWIEHDEMLEELTGPATSLDLRLLRDAAGPAAEKHTERAVAAARQGGQPVAETTEKKRKLWTFHRS